MNGLLLALVGLTAAQGEALEIAIAHEPGLAGVYAEWNERRVPFVRDGDRWLTVIGVDLDTSAGEHPLVVVRSFGNAGTRRESGQVTVAAKAFPTTELTVEPGYVDLSPENQERAAREARETATILSLIHI